MTTHSLSTYLSLNISVPIDLREKNRFYITYVHTYLYRHLLRSEVHFYTLFLTVCVCVFFSV